MTAQVSSIIPAMVASATFPFRILNIHNPMARAMGIVAAMVNNPHELSVSALTTTRPSPAIATIRIMTIATDAVVPLSLLISAFAISASDLPSCLTEATRITISCTAPAITAPTTIQTNPGKYPNCAASTGPTSGPAPAIAAKWCPNNIHLFVG